MKNILVCMFIFITTIVHAENTKTMYERFKTELSSSNLIKNKALDNLEKNQIEKGIIKKDDISYFISFSMDDLAIKEIMEQASYYNVPVYINGFVNDSIEDTASTFIRLFGNDSKYGMGIDPTKFVKYDVKVVPTMIVDCGNSIDKLVGNIPLKNAIEKIAIEGDCKSLAQNIMENVR